MVNAMQQQFAWVRPAATPMHLNASDDRPFTSFPADFTELSILDVLRRAVSADPDATALISPGERLTYAQLLQLARRTARYIDETVPKDGAVATLLPSSPTGFAGILGCLIAARVCIVLDAAHPPERNKTILADARPAAVLLAYATARHVDVIPSGTLCLTLEASGADARDWSPRRVLDPDEPALAHYTSGSTGRPKGIVISTRAALRRSQVHAEIWRTGPGDMSFSPFQPSTNAGFCLTMSTLASGGRVLMYSLDTEGVSGWLSLARDERLTLTGLPTAVARLLLSLDGAKSAFFHLREFRIGGEGMLLADLESWRKVLPKDCNISHGYASSEAMTVAHWFVPPGYSLDEPRLPAGFLLPHVEYALIDEAGRPVASGEPGELVLHSRYMACGEWAGGRCQSGRILPDPSHPGWRIFRTGDLLRFGPDGMLRFVSRLDRQVKLHGMRIEPAEIEAVLRSTPDVADAAVVDQQQDGNPVLLAYVAAAMERHDELQTVLRERLRTELPQAMRPARIVMLERMPRLPGGKLDLHRLKEAKEPTGTRLGRMIARLRGN